MNGMPKDADARSLILALLLCALVAFPGTAARAAATDERLDGALESALARTSSPGAQAAILRNGTLVWSGAAGKAITRPRKPVTTNSLFAYASFSKMMLASYALDLVEDGQLALDLPISTYVGDAVPGSGRVTLRMLLTHTAGYPEVYASPELTELFGERYDPNRLWSYGLVLDAIDTPRNPTARYRYSNAAYIVLSYILSEATTAPLHRAYADFLAPAGLSGPIDESEVTMRLTPAAARTFTHGYQFAIKDGLPPDVFAGARSIPTDLYGVPWGDGFAGTALGAAQFLDGLLVRENLLEKATLTQMLQPTEQSVRAGEPYGLGTYTIRAAGSQWQGHDGAYAGYTSMGFTDRADGVTIVVLANGYSADAIRAGAGPPATEIWDRIARAYAHP